MWRCLVVCLWLSYAKTIKPNSMKLRTKLAYIPGSHIGLFPVCPFSDVTTH